MYWKHVIKATRIFSFWYVCCLLIFFLNRIRPLCNSTDAVYRKPLNKLPCPWYQRGLCKSTYIQARVEFPSGASGAATKLGQMIRVSCQILPLIVLNRSCIMTLMRSCCEATQPSAKSHIPWTYPDLKCIWQRWSWYRLIDAEITQRRQNDIMTTFLFAIGHSRLRQTISLYWSDFRAFIQVGAQWCGFRYSR